MSGVCDADVQLSPRSPPPPQVDLYSLGVVVFEMWHPFATAMERAVLLQQLRDHLALPEEWAQGHAKVAKLIRQVAGHKPAEESQSGAPTHRL